LLITQRIFDIPSEAIGTFVADKDPVTLTVNSNTLKIQYHKRNFLPIAYGSNLTNIDNEQVNLSILEDENNNLTPSQKLLLRWHYRFGHKNIPFVQRLFRMLPNVFTGNKFTSASRCDIPLCEICQYSKSHRRKLKGIVSAIYKPSDGSLKQNHLRAGESVSVDHFESRLLGRTYNSFGRAISDNMSEGVFS